VQGARGSLEEGGFTKMPSRKSSRNQNDYIASNSVRGYSNGGYSYPVIPQYGSYNPYGTVDRRQYAGTLPRDGLYNYDPYRRGHQHDYGGGGGGAGVEDKWRHTYPYVPTSYTYQNPAPRPPPESIDLETDAGEEEREVWGSKWEFIFSCVGLSVGIGNVWRFPSLAYGNGGGSFLIVYFFLLLFIGKPMYYMELALGQFTQRGPVAIWSMCPLGRGIGIAQCIVSLIVAIYYNVIMAYCLYYIFSSFTTTVPWSYCASEGNGWGVDGDIVSNEFCYAHSNATPTWSCSGDLNNENKRCQSSSQQFFDRAVRGIDLAFTAKSAEAVEGIEVPVGLSNFTYALTDPGNIGEIKWDITLCLLLSWVVCFGCLVKGIKSSGKVVYFTATFPYVLLIAITAYGLTLDGAMDGVKELFIPKAWTGPKTITDPQVWRKAAEQMFYSLSVSWGGLVMFGSYNKFGHKVHITAATISSLDFLTSIISGLAVFSILGNLAHQQGVAVADVVAGGPGLAFITFPEALAQLPLPQLWAVMFFFMLYLLGLDSEFALIETVLTSFYDFFPKAKRFKSWLVFLLCSSCFLMSLPCVSYSGAYVFQIMDDYGGGMSVMWIAIFEMFFIMWIYGSQNFARDINWMLNSQPNGCFSYLRHYFMVVLWRLIPFALCLILGVALYVWEQPTQGNCDTSPETCIKYPDWVHGIGILLILIVVTQIPIWAVITSLYYLCAPSKRFLDVVRPTKAWGPGNKEANRSYQRHKAAVGRAQGQMQGYENPSMAGYPYYLNYANYNYHPNQYPQHYGHM